MISKHCHISYDVPLAESLGESALISFLDHIADVRITTEKHILFFVDPDFVLLTLFFQLGYSQVTEHLLVEVVWNDEVIKVLLDAIGDELWIQISESEIVEANWPFWIALIQVRQLLDCLLYR